MVSVICFCPEYIHLDASKVPWKLVLGKANWEETPGQTQNLLEELYISSGLGLPRDPPRGAGKFCCDKEIWNTLLSLLPLQPDPK